MSARTVSVVAALCVVLTGCSTSPSTSPTEWDRYEQACHDRGGFVSKTSNGVSYDRLNCVGQTSGAQLPELRV